MNILQECASAETIGISGHIRPDGDCVGSCLALYQYLRKCLPGACVKVYLEQPADIFSAIKGFDEIDTNCNEDIVFDVFFCLDCAADRLGKSCKYFEKAKKTINIDHHVSNQGCADINYIRPQVGSACELIYDLIDKEKLDKDLAMAIYVGMIHDTGVFQYSNTTPATLEKAARLIAFDLPFPKLIEETFYQKTYCQTQIMGRALIESVRFLEGRCIVSCVSKSMMEFYDAKPSDLDGIVNQLRNIKGVDCALFLYETGELEYKVSMRSDEKVDVSKIASIFGGGGHMRAAGCTMKGNFYDCINRLSLHIERQLKEQA